MTEPGIKLGANMEKQKWEVKDMLEVKKKKNEIRKRELCSLANAQTRQKSLKV